MLTGLYPGVTLADARERTGWDLDVAPDLVTLPAPASAELTALRKFTARTEE